MFLQKIKQQARSKISKLRHLLVYLKMKLKMKQEAEANADKDKSAKETADKINGADGMIFQTEKQLKEFGDKLSDDKKTPVEEALKELKAAHESKNIENIDAAMEKINNAWKAASEEMYKASQEQAPADDQGATDNTTDDVTDVEFEEVKDEKKINNSFFKYLKEPCKM